MSSKLRVQRTTATSRTHSSGVKTVIGKNNNINSNSNINNRHFITCIGNRSSPFKSFFSTGSRVRRNSQSELNDFAYDLSKDELHYMRDYQSPMKSVPDDQRALLRNGQREAYLARRNEHSPNHKYNYPQATSWRIGWFHNPECYQQRVN